MLMKNVKIYPYIIFQIIFQLYILLIVIALFDLKLNYVHTSTRS